MLRRPPHFLPRPRHPGCSHFSTTRVVFKRQARPTLEVNFGEKEGQEATVTLVNKADQPETLLKRVDRLLYLDKPSAALGHACERLSHLDATTQPGVVQDVIETFLRHNRVDEAQTILKRMTSRGFLPSRPLHTTMRVIHCFRPNLAKETVLEELGQVFASAAKNDIDEARLSWLMSHLTMAGHHPRFQECVLDRFVATQGPDYRVPPDIVTRMINQYSFAGASKDARRWLIYHSQKVADERIPPHPKDAFPYTTYIAAINRHTTGRYKYGAVLYRMWKDKVLPDTAFFNVLIKAQANEKRPGKAFQLYNALQSNYDNERFPDEFTYGTLFKALETYGGKRTALNIIPPRTLFRQMLGWNDFASRKDVVSRVKVASPSILSLALRMFLNARDDAAALVVIQTFDLLAYPIHIEQSNTVVDALIQRVHTSLECASPRRVDYDWLLRFLRCRWEDRAALQRCPPSDTRKKIVQIGNRVDAEIPPWPRVVRRFSHPHTQPSSLERQKSAELRDFTTNVLSHSLAALCPNFGQTVDRGLPGWHHCKDQILQAIDEMVPPMGPNGDEVVLEGG